VYGGNVEAKAISDRCEVSDSVSFVSQGQITPSPIFLQLFKFSVKEIYLLYSSKLQDGRRSQCPSGLKHEISSPARTLESWIRIQIQAWIFAFILCLCCSV
jgi:hypothetical protein